ncbi:MAG: histidine kinase [Candidatus Cohnella colombiensis]|uniref:histidine kinase n=1 Tax=Candidatus Cohnella colombiensis TaxID=3121368 RepID=A0AA95EXH8_9BACL|nr:MAG: histidine kinase [Cohnella sp.]
MKKLIGCLAAFCALLAILYMVFSDKDTSSVEIKAVDGVLDLRELTDRSMLISLAGDWKFTSDSYVPPTNFKNESMNLQVPGPWSSDSQWGSYQLIVYLPDNHSDIGIRVRNIWSAHSLYVNGKKLSEYGKEAPSKQEMSPDNRPYEIYITPDSNKLLITIHVSNFYNARGGIVFPIDIGDATLMKEDVQHDIMIEWSAVFCLLLFSVFHITIYLLRTKDEAFLYSGLYFMMLSILIMTRGERLLLREFPSIPFDFFFRLQDSVTFLSVLLLIAFISMMFPLIIHKRAMFLLYLPITIYTFLNIILPARTVSGAQYVFFFYGSLIVIIAIVRIFYMTFRHQINFSRNEALILGLTLLFLVLSSLSGSFDSLFFNGRNSLNRIGLVGFVLCMNIFLGMRLMNRAEQSEQLNARLEKANKAKDDFLKVTTQELQQPLHDAVNLIKSTAREEHKVKQGEQLYLAEQIMERMVYLLRDLIDFTRIRFDDYGAIELGSTNVRMVVLHVIQLMQLTFTKKKIQIYEQVPDGFYVWADKQRLTQVMLRIMTEISLDTVESSITIDSIIVGDSVQIRFTTVRATSSTYADRQPSSGLMMTEEIMHQMNGNFTLERTESKLSFTLQLTFSEYKNPDVLSERDSDIQVAATVEETELAALLIVEDDVMHAEVIRGMLNNTYRVHIAYSTQEALSYFEQHPKLLTMIIDDILPGSKSGLQLLQKIRKHASLMELPILMMTSSEYPGYIEEIFAAGANDYLVKPFSKETLMARLNAVEQTKIYMSKAIEHEMAFLQTQIKPHFLYNALSSIISFCYTDGERAAYLLTMLSSFLRYIFETSRDGQYSTLQKELEIIEAYVEVEKARFGERLSFSYAIDPAIATDNVMIPSLLLQPLVENAIRHGLFEKEGPGQVQVTISVHGAHLHIQVVDDGVGMSAVQCAQLMGEAPANAGIGFTNVRRRVHELIQGHLEIFSLPDKGTTIHLKFPIKEGQFHVESSYRRG